MKPDFECLQGAEGWQLSNPPILQLAVLRASMELFDRAGMLELRKKSDRLTRYLEELLAPIPGVAVITPARLEERGTQISFRVKGQSAALVSSLLKRGVMCDFREPDVIRVAPVPLYTRFADVNRFVEQLKLCL
jgi:kynureninase